MGGQPHEPHGPTAHQSSTQVADDLAFASHHFTLSPQQAAVQSPRWPPAHPPALTGEGREVGHHRLLGLDVQVGQHALVLVHQRDLGHRPRVVVCRARRRAQQQLVVVRSQTDECRHLEVN